MKVCDTQDLVYTTTLRQAKDYHRQRLTLLADDVCGTVTAHYYADKMVVQLVQNLNGALPHVLATVPEDYPVTKYREIIIKRNTDEINT
jgi:hypothetical protein